MDKLSATVTGTSNILSINVTASHNAQSSIAIVEALSTTLDIGDEATVTLGYVGDTDMLLRGYVKLIECKEAPLTYTITISDVLVRAMDFFIASSNPEEPFSRQNITAEALVGDVLALAGITDYVGEASGFTLAMTVPVEINLTTAYDYAKFIADLLAFNLYADTTGVVHFRRRLPYPDGDTPIATLTNPKITQITNGASDKELRNRVVVYGAAGVYAEASAVSPYLPPGFYKSCCVAAPQVFDNVPMAQQAADYNLELLNRLTETISVTVLGKPLYQPRNTINIVSAEVGAAGEWYIYATTHSWGASGYTVQMELRR